MNRRSAAWIAPPSAAAESKSANKLETKPANAVEAASQPATEKAASEAEAVPATKAQGSDAAKARSGEGERSAGARQGRGRRGATAAEAAPKLQRGAKAPDFALADQAGKQHQLADYRGKHVLVWFYPKADTPGCTAQGCGLRDQFAEFMDRGVIVLGASFDDQAANAAWKQKHGFVFPLLCDTDRALAIAYGAAEDGNARTARRVAVLIDPTGKVAQVWTKVDPATFAATVLAALPL